ncbi:MAG: ceramidase domain-containing protein, partial [Thermoanaerobaculia bacterium]
GLVLYAVIERGVLATVPPGTMGGSLLYLPPVLALAALAGYARHRAHPAASRLAAAVGVFAVAIAVRTLDSPLCQAWPTGTHFVWHVLAAWVLYLAATAVLAPRGAPSG